jgi:CubicO group peptidase (beta-lactamase class C family)
MRRVGSLPLLYQPGEKWLYNTGADVLGVLIARAAGQSLGSFLAERVFDPLGMRDTGFSASDTERLTSCYLPGPELFDAPDGHWSKPPAFEAGGGGLVSTLDDYFAFATMLQSSGRLPDGSRLLSRASVEAMTSPHALDGPSFDGSQAWGFGTSVQVRRTGLAPGVGSYGWAGGLGTSWANDPNERLIGIVLTTDAFAGAFPPPAIVQDFWTGCYASLV